MMYTLLVLWALLWVASLFAAYEVGVQQGRLTERKVRQSRQRYTIKR